jgi:3-methyladenine DNA glycosylase AlkD
MLYKKIIDGLEGLSDPKRAEGSQRFFKTGKGQYGEGDVFLGITMPALRAYCKKCQTEIGVLKQGEETSPLLVNTIEKLLQNKYHEVRMAGVLLLISLAKNEPKKAFETYVANTGVGKGINNWDLIDVATPRVIGPLVSKNKQLLDKWIKSPDLWVNRMAVLATAYEISRGNPGLILEMAPKLTAHKHDLIHKAVGWMLREMGKRCGEKYLIEFLDMYSPRLPRTMLRYAIERLDGKKKEKYKYICKNF